MSNESRVITVEIAGQRYPIRSSLESAYVAELAAYLDEKIRMAARETTSGDSLKIAVLAALNVADELFRCRAGQGAVQGQWREKAEALERLLDEALAPAIRSV
jgi:cell division protein ZapA